MRELFGQGFTELLRAQTPVELSARVISANWEVPAERKIRDKKLNEHIKKQKERWTLARFLLSPQMPELVRCPVVVFEGERPDFMLASEGHRVGLEVSQIARGIDNKFAAEAERCKCRIWHVPDPEDSASELSGKDICERLTDTGYTPAGWIGDSPERLFLTLTCNKIGEKIDRAKKYHAADEHWLLLYANFAMPLSNASLHQTGVFQKIAHCAEGARKTFRHVLIWKGNELLVF